MTSALDDRSLDQIFRSARTPNGWADRPLEDETVREIYDLMKWGPTSANCSPARFVWVRSADGKATLAGLAAELNKPKTLKAPVTVIIGHDLDFAAELPRLLPHNAELMQKYFALPGVAEVTAMRNGTLQGAFLIVAARALGLDCGPLQRLEAQANIEIHFGSEATALHGGDHLEEITVRSRGGENTLQTRALFAMIGASPNTEWLSDLVKLDKRGFVKTGKTVGADRPFETSRQGIFAIGDVRAGSVKRIASAAGEGSVVVPGIYEFLGEQITGLGPTSARAVPHQPTSVKLL
jgi:3-hydroxypropanoate dehydrogenase